MSAPNRKLEDEEEPQEPNYLALLPKELFLELVPYCLSNQWDDPTSLLRVRFIMDGRGNYVKCMHLLREKNTLITGSHDGRLREWDLLTGESIRTTFVRHTNPSTTDPVRIHSLDIYDDIMVIGTEHGTVCQWSYSKFKPIALYIDVSKIVSSCAKFIVKIFEGRVYAAFTSYVYMWELSSRKLIRSKSLKEDRPQLPPNLNFSPPFFLLSGGEDSFPVIHVYHMRTFELAQRIPLAGTQPVVRSMRGLGDFVVGVCRHSSEVSLCVWNIRQGDLVDSFRLPTNFADVLSLHGHIAVLATDTDSMNEIQLWDYRRGKCLRKQNCIIYASDDGLILRDRLIVLLGMVVELWELTS